MRIQHNLSAMNSLTNYHGNNNALSNNLEKLSSGYKINSAADDAAGLAISEKMRSQIAGLEKAQDNANDGISLIQTAEGALTEVNSMLTRLKSLATQSANGTYEDGVDRANIQEETDALLEEIDRISQSTNFNGINLLDGSLSGKSQVDNVAIDETKAVTGVYTAAAAIGSFTNVVQADGAGTSLNTNDIGKSIDYTVTWKNAAGEEKTTTVSLTFQGQGDGTVNTQSGSLNKNYFTDDIGTKYKLDDNGNLKSSDIRMAISAGLKGNAEFSAAFNVDFIASEDKATIDEAKLDASKDGKQASVLKLTAKDMGSAGAVMIGTSVKSNLVSASQNTVTGAIQGAGTANVNRQALDSMQRFNVKNLNYVAKGAKKEDMQQAIFEIDGQKFMLASANFTNTDMKAVDSDVTVIKLTASVAGSLDAADSVTKVGTINANGANNASIASVVAAAITKQTGMQTKAYADGSSDTVKGIYDKAKLSSKANIDAGDVVFSGTGGAKPQDKKLKLDGNDLSLQIGDTNKDYQKVSVKIQDMSSKGLGLKGLDLSNQESAGAAVDTIQAAVNAVSTQRGQLGALQNRLEHTLNNLDATDQNITAAESQIRDVDMAKEMTQYSKNNILTQAAQSMLAQANSMPQGVLSLLG